jgi:hypothetical protein
MCWCQAHRTRILFLSDSCWFVDEGRPLWREDGSVVYNCCGSSSEQSFSDPSLAGLMIIIYCLKFECKVPVFIFPKEEGGTVLPCRQWVWVSFKLCRIEIRSVRTLQGPRYFSATKVTWLLLFCKIIAIYCEDLTKHTEYTVWAECGA